VSNHEGVNVQNGEYRFPKIRIRDLNWEAVARVQRQIAKDRSGRVRVAWSKGMRRTTLFAHALAGREPDSHFPFSAELPRWLCPRYPLVSIEQAAKLARGATPRSLSNNELSASEAHEWLSHYPHLEPEEFLA